MHSGSMNTARGIQHFLSSPTDWRVVASLSLPVQIAKPGAQPPDPDAKPGAQPPDSDLIYTVLAAPNCAARACPTARQGPDPTARQGPDPTARQGPDPNNSASPLTLLFHFQTSGAQPPDSD